MTWQGKTVIVTGGTRGIGAATVELFAGCGAHVIGHGQEDGDELVAGIRAAGGRVDFLAGDLRDPAEGRRLTDFALQHTGRIDVLVNNAGANVFAGTVAAGLDEWNDCLDLDLRAVWLVSRAAAEHLGRPAAIVNVASNHAHSTMPGIFPYNVAKAGVLALTQSLALELADRGIRVNAVCPGYIATPINDAYFSGFDNPAAERARVEALHPLRRIGRPEDVARAIRFLADEDESGFMTGTSLTVDGGRSALMQDPSEK